MFGRKETRVNMNDFVNGYVSCEETVTISAIELQNYIKHSKLNERENTMLKKHVAEQHRELSLYKEDNDMLQDTVTTLRKRLNGLGDVEKTISKLNAKIKKMSEALGISNVLRDAANQRANDNAINTLPKRRVELYNAQGELYA